MCYSAEVSFATWAFGMLSAMVLVSTGTPVRTLLLPLVIVQMQLIEGVRWLDVVDESVLAVLGKLTLFLQPIAGFVQSGATQFILPYVVIQLAAEALAGSRDLRFVVAEDGHFTWKWWTGQLDAIPYLVAMTIAGYLAFPFPLFALSLSLMLYYVAQHSKYGTVGSLWCVSVNIVWIYYLLFDSKKLASNL